MLRLNAMPGMPVARHDAYDYLGNCNAGELQQGPVKLRYHKMKLKLADRHFLRHFIRAPVQGVCSEAASFDLQAPLLSGCIAEAERAYQLAMLKAESGGGSGPSDTGDAP